MCRYQYHAWRDRNYRHEFQYHTETAIKQALDRAAALSKEVGNHARRNPVRTELAGGKPPLHSILKQPDNATALAATDPDWIGPTEWLMDTGSSIDLVGVHEIPDDFLHEYALDVPTPVNLSTANGKLAAKQIH